ncbi:hypothetical protein HJC23_008699 [Cyclotella cryptica]|uniref:DUF1995 domain-containing protein n=1 Tax=Cyclotella cryptica TaxID=29204 RepID=A0ABD3QGU6_9STRA|eukprot:CCRYP_005416-RA/>CCRYP_005416-RA protein AED:0.03 eAED:0.02 QI:0/-1/0/1/-1/1/1/0/388
MLALTILIIAASICRSFSFSNGLPNTRLLQSASRPIPSRFSARPDHRKRSNAPKALYLSSEDEVRALLEKAKRLREEAAAMSGKTLEEIEEESKREKKQMEERKLQLTEIARNKSQRGAGAAPRIVPVPEDARSQVQQAASAVERAFKDGIVRQTIRFALLTDDEEMSGELNEWPGGAKQMFREAGRPLTEALLREVNVDASGKSNLPPTITTKDIWDFDGSAVVSSKNGSERRGGDVTALVFPNTDIKYLKDIETIDKDVGPEQLFLLINPFWRDVESWGFNILQPNGKKRAQEVVFDNGYDVTYAVQRFSARGEDCIALKAYPYDWQMYAYREDPSWFNRQIPIWLGSSKEEPSSSQFSELLNARPEFKMSKNMRQMQRMMGNDDQ